MGEASHSESADRSPSQCGKRSEPDRAWKPISVTLCRWLSFDLRGRWRHHGLSLLHPADRLVHLPPVNCDSLRMFNPKSHFVAPDLDHRENDVVPKDDALVLHA